MSAIKAYSYIRMSTEEQLKGDSLRRQINACRKFADEQKLELDETVRLRDIGVSAFHSKNRTEGNLGTFLKLVEDGDIERGSYLLVDSMDRLSRDDPTIAMQLLTQIVQSGITVATLDDRQVYSTVALKQQPFMLFIALGAMLRSNSESSTKSGRLLSAWTGKRGKARSEKRTVMTKLMPAWLHVNPDDGTIVADKHRAKIVVEIFEKLRDGYGTYSITREFNRRGEANWSTRSQHWSDSYVKKISKNRAVLGECQPHTVFHDEFGNYTRVVEGEAISGYFPAVISEQLFHAANHAMRARRLTGAGRKGEGIPNLFTGLLKCGFCSAGLQYIDKGPPPKGGKYVRCSRSVQGGKCKAMNLRYERLERGLLQMIGSIDVERILGGASAKTKLTSKRNQLSEQLAKSDSLKLRLARLSNSIQEAEDPGVRKALAGSVSALFAETEACDSLVASLQAEIAQMEVIDPQAHQQSIAKLLESIRWLMSTILTARRQLSWPVEAGNEFDSLCS